MEVVRNRAELVIAHSPDLLIASGWEVGKLRASRVSMGRGSVWRSVGAGGDQEEPCFLCYATVVYGIRGIAYGDGGADVESDPGVPLEGSSCEALLCGDIVGCRELPMLLS